MMRPVIYLTALLLRLPLLQAQTPSDFSPLADIVQEKNILGMAGVASMQVDSKGDVYLAGTVTSPSEIPAATKIGSALGNIDVYIVKLDPTLEHVLFATVIGGSNTDEVRSMKVDASGNVYLTGYSFSLDFPYTGHLQTPSSEGSFVLKLSAAGDALIYATQLGQIDVSALDVDPSGNAYVGGNAAGDKIPSTPGAYRPSPVADGSPYLLKLAASGAATIFATYVGDPSALLRGVSAKPDGKVVFLTSNELGSLSGNGATLLFTTPLEFSSATFAADSLGMDAAGNFFVSSSGVAEGYTVRKFSAGGTALEIRMLAGAAGNTRMLVSSLGRIYLTGSAASGAGFPTRYALETCLANTKLPLGSAGLSAQPGGDNAFVVYQPDGTLAYSSFLHTELQAATLSPDGRYLYAYARQANFAADSILTNRIGFVRFDLSRVPMGNHLAPSCLAHGATYAQAPATPGEIMTIYGSNLGPEQGVSFALRNGLVPTDLAGTSLFVDGKPAPVLYVQDIQINFVVPWSARTQGLTSICIARNGEAACLNATADLMAPAPFQSGGSAMILHQDGTLNSSTNRLSRGHYVSLYLTGTGTLDGPLIDGSISGFPLQFTTANVQASITDDIDHSSGCTGINGNPCPQPRQLPVTVAYAGSAPTSVSGVTQINLLIPSTIPLGQRSLTITFTAGTSSRSSSATIWIAP